MNLPHLVESKTQAGFTYEMEFIQLMIEDGTIYNRIDEIDEKPGKDSCFSISKLIMSH